MRGYAQSVARELIRAKVAYVIVMGSIVGRLYAINVGMLMRIS